MDESVAVSVRSVCILIGLTSLVHATTQSSSCRVSEFFCDTGQCVALDKYCDGSYDCTDKSDEPRYCSRKYSSLF
ncbi:hypothetical protein O3M35_001044 [Rhynocoris fuscipes]|uniref:Uncharacterized protein n=1 Tax=Rhynocoris fuscipes TaxID=488301 RepID=A0AAW1DTS1_9HEMI